MEWIIIYHGYGEAPSQGRWLSPLVQKASEAAMRLHLCPPWEVLTVAETASGKCRLVVSRSLRPLWGVGCWRVYNNGVIIDDGVGSPSLVEALAVVVPHLAAYTGNDGVVSVPMGALAVAETVHRGDPVEKSTSPSSVGALAVAASPGPRSPPPRVGLRPLWGHWLSLSWIVRVR